MLTLEQLKTPAQRLTAEGVTNFEGVDMTNLSLFVTDYSSYLKSGAWKDKKREWLQSGRPPYCFVCEEPMPRDQRGFNFHHRSYENLYNEPLNDLVLLCREHHYCLEKEYKDVKGRIPLWDWTYMYISMERSRLGKRPISNSIFNKYLPMGEFNE